MSSPKIMMEMSRRSLLRRTAGIGAGALAASFLGARAHAAAPKFKTVESGFITIAMSGTMPVTGIKDGQIIGSDAEMIVAIAGHLGLGVKPAVMAWSATIEAIKSGRADIMCGDMGWTKARANAMLLTDAIYYDGNFVTMKKDKPFKGYIDVNDMSGHSVGTGQGYSYVPDLKKIPGIGEVKLYDNVDGCLRDVLAGRIDFAVLDSMNVDYMLLQNPSTDLKLVPIKPNTTYPNLSGKGRAVMGMNLENPDLFDAVNAGVKWLWASKKNAELLAKYGMTSPDYLVAPTGTNPRIGVDRDGKGNILGPGAHTPKDFSKLFA
ncbi:MAG TPA: transporter substrate-binding domain-containing protein [Alphaproteobacteria bacterium]|nr:transporter substrate-binding domain-containing protein [Alphaproteobacteria bacterium]